VKEATGELNMTVITVIAIAAIGVFLFAFLPGILDSIRNNWDKSNCTVNSQGQTVCNGVIQH